MQALRLHTAVSFLFGLLSYATSVKYITLKTKAFLSFASCVCCQGKTDG